MPKSPRHLELALGFSHPVIVDAPEGVTFEVPTPLRIIVKGIDKEEVGQVAADIRKVRKPEPYKGKGVRYAGEVVTQGREGGEVAMSKTLRNHELRVRRHRRVRKHVIGTAERPRLTVFRSNKHIVGPDHRRRRRPYPGRRLYARGGPARRRDGQHRRCHRDRQARGEPRDRRRE